MTTPAKTRLYRTERTLARTLRVAYPSGRGRMVLRTEQDWDRDLEPMALSEDGNVSTFALEVGRFSPLVELRSNLLDRDHKIRGYVPPGYDENTLSRFPVVFMQDGQ